MEQIPEAEVERLCLIKRSLIRVYNSGAWTRHGIFCYNWTVLGFDRIARHWPTEPQASGEALNHAKHDPTD